jgi:hypothetical protein
MIIRADWRYLRGDPPESGPFHATVTWAAAVLFGVMWVAVLLLGSLALRFF